MHPHGLHKTVETECLCCRRVEGFVFTSRHDQVLCQTCKGHAGDSTQRRERREADHIQQWRDDLEAWRGHYDRKIATLTEKVEDLEGKLAEEVEKRPEKIIYKHVGQDEIDDAHARRHDASRARDYAMRVASDFALRHGEDEDKENTCRCGKPLRRCNDGQAVEMAGHHLHRWEERRIERLRTGRDTERTTMLPAGHPALLNRRYLGTA